MANNVKYPKISPYIPEDHDEDEENISDKENDIVEFEKLCSKGNDFDGSSFKDKVIAKQKLFKFLEITDISKTFLSDQLIKIIRNSPELDSPIDWTKFISFISILVKGTREEKLKLFYLLFEKNTSLGGGKPRNFGDDSTPGISKEELMMNIQSTILSMLSVTFEDPAIERIKADVMKQNEQCIDSALAMAVSQIFTKHSKNGEDLSFEEWCNWFQSLDGIEEILEPKNLFFVE